mgnify:CR=1 FL=1
MYIVSIKSLVSIVPMWLYFITKHDVNYLLGQTVSQQIKKSYLWAGVVTNVKKLWKIKPQILNIAQNCCIGITIIMPRSWRICNVYSKASSNALIYISTRTVTRMKRWWKKIVCLQEIIDECSNIKWELQKST